jgi:hypothetical protein
MTKNEVIVFFNGVNATARALRIRPSAVSKWPEVLTERIAYKVELATNGALKTEETIKRESL